MPKMNIGIWIGIIGAIVGFAIGVAAVFVSTGEAGPYIAAGMLVVFGGMFFLFYKVLFAPMINNSRLQKHGINGKARILDVLETGVTINDRPQVKLVLEVKNNLGQKYNATCKTVVSLFKIGMFQVGMEVPVKIDPKNEQNVVIDYSGGAATGIIDHQLRDELETLQQQHETIRSTGVAARAIVKSYTWLGVNVNGNNPFAELEVEVLPDNAPSFSGLIRAVFGEQGRHKYQPGKEIRVKYDRYDNTRVTVDQ